MLMLVVMSFADTVQQGNVFSCDMACRDFAQGNNGIFVFAARDEFSRTVAQLARTGAG